MGAAVCAGCAAAAEARFAAGASRRCASAAAESVSTVIALLCAPAVLALQRANSLSGAMVRSSVIGASCSVGGFGLALVLDLPPGPLIGWLCLLLLLLPKQGHRPN